MSHFRMYCYITCIACYTGYMYFHIIMAGKTNAEDISQYIFLAHGTMKHIIFIPLLSVVNFR